MLAVVLAVVMVVGWTVSQINFVSPSRKGPRRSPAALAFLFFCVFQNSLSSMCQPKPRQPATVQDSHRMCLCFQKRVPLSSASTATTLLCKEGFNDNNNDNLPVVVFPLPARHNPPLSPLHTHPHSHHLPGTQPRPRTEADPPQPHIFPDVTLYLDTLPCSNQYFLPPSKPLYIHFSLSSPPSTPEKETRETKARNPFNSTPGEKREGARVCVCEWHRISHCRSVHMSGPPHSLPSTFSALLLHGGGGSVMY